MWTQAPSVFTLVFLFTYGKKTKRKIVKEGKSDTHTEREEKERKREREREKKKRGTIN